MGFKCKCIRVKRAWVVLHKNYNFNGNYQIFSEIFGFKK